MDPKQIAAIATTAGVAVGVGVTAAVIAIKNKMSDPATEALEAAAKLVEKRDRNERKS